MTSSRVAIGGGKAGMQTEHCSESSAPAQLSSLPVTHLQQLQRTLGNRAVGRMVGGGGATVQPQRPAGQAGALSYEEETGTEIRDESAAAAIPLQLRRSAAWADDGPAQGPTDLVIQRAIGYAPSGDKNQLDADLAGNPKSISRFSHAEALTRTAGTASDTGNFSHGSGSDKLENVRIKYNGDDIGYVRALGKDKGNFDPNVKMHLVNSFLHPDANNWDQNWVWGHGDLNHAHDRELERKAKDYHPATTGKTLTSGEAIYAMAYRTEVKAKASTAMDASELSAQIQTQVEAKKPLPDWKTDDNLLTSITVNDAPISNYAGDWTSAVAATVASSVESFLTIYGVDGTGNVVSEPVTLGSVTDNDATEYRVVIEKEGGWFAGKKAFTAPENRKRRSAATKENDTKKIK